MSEEVIIITDQLHPATDYEYLMAKGIEYINELNQTTWTNMNPSDPGITILDQLCYALTELGYVNNFPIKDILTNEAGKLDVENQFFLPDQILTSSSLTCLDFIKYLVDSIEEIKNASVFAMAHCESNARGALFSYLLAENLEITGKPEICLTNDANFALNSSRNIGESIVLPMTLIPAEFTLSGRVDLTREASAKLVSDDIALAITNFILPPVQQEGYDSLIAQGYSPSTIFQGPRLQNGWIPDANVSSKKNTIRTIDILNLINGVDGVKSMQNIEMHPLYTEEDIYGLSFENGVMSVPREVLPVYCDELIIICKGGLVYYQDGVKVDPTKQPTDRLYDNELKQFNLEEDLGASLDVLPELPEGKFRDIEDYYSVQNTFPDIYGINSNAHGDIESEFSMAASRQLKGYLMVYDQILANQFSQLANVHKLFSFSNSMYGYQKGLYDLKQQTDQWYRGQTSAPSPFRDFMPTYFYQALYDVPNVQPLLKGDEHYMYFMHEQPDNVKLAKAWKEFKADPNNEYMLGLRTMMEDDETALQRRNNMLDHLLARHGIAAIGEPLYSNNNFWSGNTQLNEILTKSILLQNYDLFSYNRMKGFDILSADPIDNYLEPETGAQTIDYWARLFLDEYTVGGSSSMSQEQINEWLLKLEQQYGVEATAFLENGWLDTKAMEYFQKLSELDFNNYSSVELKMNLLLGITFYYNLLCQIIYAYETDDRLYLLGEVSLEFTYPDEAQLLLEGDPVITIEDAAGYETGTTLMTDVARQLHWFSTQRRGFLFIENPLLLCCAGFHFYFLEGTTENGTLWGPTKQFCYDDAMMLYDACFRKNAVGISKFEDTLTVRYLKETYVFTNPQPYGETGQPDKDDFRDVNQDETGKFMVYASAIWCSMDQNDEPTEVSLENELFSSATTMVFPSYPQQFIATSTQDTITNLAQETVPAHIDNKVLFRGFEYLEDTLIPAFIAWRNSLRFSDPNGKLDWDIMANPTPPNLEDYCNEDYRRFDSDGHRAAYILVNQILNNFEE